MSIKAKIGREIVKQLPREGTIAFGSGTTVNAIIAAVGKMREEFTNVDFVSGSSLTSTTMKRLGVKETVDPASIDICIDGADQVLSADPRYILKGRGGALFREKVLWKEAERIVIGITPDKIVDTLSMAVPVEVDPFAQQLVTREICKQFPTSDVVLRTNSNEFVFYTDNGNVIMDCDIISDTADILELDSALKSLTGVVETGLFTSFGKSITALVGDETTISTIQFEI